jgi:hypothetical protein
VDKMRDYEKQALNELILKLKENGLRVFVAKKGCYGFFANSSLEKVVSFQSDFSSFKFSGNYKTSNPKETGQGWQLEEELSFYEMLNSIPPRWAVRDNKWKLKTVKDYLNIYQKSSKFKEVFKGQHFTKFGEPIYKTKNYGYSKLNRYHSQTRVYIFADMFHPITGEFYRRAPIAEVNYGEAESYCKKRNNQ